MPNPTRARAAQPAGNYVAARSVRAETTRCETCLTALGPADFRTDPLGRGELVCPNRWRHGTGWQAVRRIPLDPPKENTRETYAPPVKEYACCEWPGCTAAIAIRWAGKRRRWCDEHVKARAKQTHAAYRQRSKDALRLRAKRTRNRRSA